MMQIPEELFYKIKSRCIFISLSKAKANRKRLRNLVNQAY